MIKFLCNLMFSIGVVLLVGTFLVGFVEFMRAATTAFQLYNGSI